MKAIMTRLRKANGPMAGAGIWAIIAAILLLTGGNISSLTVVLVAVLAIVPGSACIIIAIFWNDKDKDNDNGN
jgi:uncharacterized membrane protein HdeD (DUF308 family)